MELEMKYQELPSGDAILRAVESGESLVLTHRGTPVAEVVPIRRPRKFVPKEELLQAFRNLPGTDSYAQLRADLDAIIDPYDDPDRHYRQEHTDDIES